MKYWKKALSVLLALSMVMSLVSFSAFAEGGEDESFEETVVEGLSEETFEELAEENEAINTTGDTEGGNDASGSDDANNGNDSTEGGDDASSNGDNENDVGNDSTDSGSDDANSVTNNGTGSNGTDSGSYDANNGFEGSRVLTSKDAKKPKDKEQKDKEQKADESETVTVQVNIPAAYFNDWSQNGKHDWDVYLGDKKIDTVKIHVTGNGPKNGNTDGSGSFYFSISSDDRDGLSGAETIQFRWVNGSGKEKGNDKGNDTVTFTLEKQGENVYKVIGGGEGAVDEGTNTCSHVNATTTITTEPTCTKGGVKTTTCTYCGKDVKEEPIAPLGHSFKNDNTCDNGCGLTVLKYDDGNKIFVPCGDKIIVASVKGQRDSWDWTILNMKEESVSAGLTVVGKDAGGDFCYVQVTKDAAVGSYLLRSQANRTHYYALVNVVECLHTEEPFYDVTEPATCATEGSETPICKTCGKKLASKPITTIPHDCNEETVAATCMEAGGILYKCKNCDYSNFVQDADKLSHIPGGDWHTDGTHHWHICTRENCGAKVEETVADHKWTEKDGGVDPNCSDAGREAIYQCTDCGRKKGGAEIPALGHKEVTDKAVAATCTEAGKTEGKHCSVCSEILVAQQTVPAKGHELSEFNCSETEHWKTCAHCDYEERADHNWDAGKVTTAPAYIAEGVRTFKCNDCDQTKTEAIGKLYDDEAYMPMPKIEIPEEEVPLADLPEIETVIEDNETPLSENPFDDVDTEGEEAAVSDVLDIEENEIPMSAAAPVEVEGELSELEDEEVPLAAMPEIEIEDEDVPLAAEPEIKEIEDEEVPLAAMPESNSSSVLWIVLGGVVLAGSLLFVLIGKKRKEESKN